MLTGCSVREPDRAGLRRRYPAVDLFLRPDEEPELVDRLGLASAQAPIGARRATDDGRGRTVVGAADGLAGDPGRAPSGRGRVARGSAISAWLPIIYGCDKTCTYCIVPFSRGPGAEPAVRRDRRRGARARGGRLPRGDAARPERQLATATTCRRSRASPTSTTERWAGRRLDLARPAGPRRADPGHRRPADRRRPAGHRAPALRHVAPVGPLGPAHRGDGRVRERLRAPAPAGPVGRRRGAAADGPPVHDRALPRAARADPRGRPGHHRSRPTSSSASAARPRRSSRRRCALLETVRYDQVFAAAYSPRPGTPAHEARRRRPGRRQAPPPQRAARAPGGDRPRAQPGLARPRGRGPRRRASRRRARTSTTTTPTSARAPAGVR